MKKRISVYIGVLLICSLIVSGIVCAAASLGNSPVIGDDPINTETPASLTDPVLNDSGPDYPVSKPVHTEPTPEALLQELKDDLTEAPEKKAALAAEYEALVSERDALSAKQNASGLTDAELYRQFRVEKRISELRFMDIYPDIDQALEVNFINMYEQMRLEEEATLKYRNLDEILDASEINQAKALVELAIELKARFESGEDVETLYLYYFEQVYAINGIDISQTP
jgi:hypothetical protein